MAPMAQLPAEILCQILENIHDRAADPDVALPTSHVTTKTLLACTQTSRLFHSIANPILYCFCLYLDTHNKILDVASTLSDQPWLASHITQLYLAPSSMDSTEHVASIIHATSKTLKRLVIDAPIRDYFLNAEIDDVIPRTWRAAFISCTALEEFTSVQDMFYLFTQEDPPHNPYTWSHWPKLHSLALYNLIINDFTVSQIPASVRTLVLTRPDFPGRNGFAKLALSTTLERVVFANFRRELEYKLGLERKELDFVDADHQWELEVPGQLRVGFLKVNHRMPGTFMGMMKIAQVFVGKLAVQGNLWAAGKRMYSLEEFNLLKRRQESLALKSEELAAATGEHSGSIW